MTVQESPVLPALPDRARRFRWGHLGVRSPYSPRFIQFAVKLHF